MDNRNPELRTPNSEGLLNDLKDILDEEVKVLKDLLRLTTEDRSLAVALNYEKLSGNNKKKEYLSLRMKVLEEGREAVVQKLAGLMGLKDEKVNPVRISPGELNPVEKNGKDLISSSCSRTGHSNGVKLADIIDRWGDNPNAIQLRSLHKSLLELTERIKEADNINRAIFKHSLEVINGSINFFNHALGKDSVYHPRGRSSSYNNEMNVFSQKV